MDENITNNTSVKKYIDSDFIRDELEDCILDMPDFYCEDCSAKGFLEEGSEPYVNWNDILSCLATAELLSPLTEEFVSAAVAEKLARENRR